MQAGQRPVQVHVLLVLGPLNLEGQAGGGRSPDVGPANIGFVAWVKVRVVGVLRQPVVKVFTAW